jgi:hypothetical protein
MLKLLIVIGRAVTLAVVRQNQSRPFYAPERHEPVRLC